MEPRAPADPNRSLEAQVRLRRRAWRRRRRWIGTLAFLAVVAVLAVVVAATLGGDGGSGGSAGGIHAARSASSTTSTLPPAGPYRVNGGLNVRSGPGAAYPVIGTLELGAMVKIACVADGDQVTGTSGTTNKWLRLWLIGPTSYVSAAYVGVGNDVANPQVIPVCTS